MISSTGGRRTAQKGFDWADLSQPFLDNKNVDATGHVDLWCPCFLQLTPVVTLYLIKFHLLQNLKGIMRLRETTPPGSPTPTVLPRQETRSCPSSRASTSAQATWWTTNPLSTFTTTRAFWPKR